MTRRIPGKVPFEVRSSYQHIRYSSATWSFWRPLRHINIYSPHRVLSIRHWRPHNWVMWGSMEWQALHCHLLHISQCKYVSLLGHSSGRYWSYISRSALHWACRPFSPEQTPSLALSGFTTASWKYLRILKNGWKWMTSLSGGTSKINLPPITSYFDALVHPGRFLHNTCQLDNHHQKTVRSPKSRSTTQERGLHPLYLRTMSTLLLIADSLLVAMFVWWFLTIIC